MDLAALRHAQYYETMLRAFDAEYAGGVSDSASVLRLYDLDAVQINHGYQCVLRHADESHDAESFFLGYTFGGMQIWNVRMDARARLTILKKARRICRRCGDREQELMAMRHQAAAMLDLGRVNGARRRYQYVLRFAQNDQIRLYALCGIGRLFANTGKVNEAIEHSNEAIKLCSGDEQWRCLAISYSNLSRAYIAKKEYEESIAFCEKELALAIDKKDKHSEADAYGGLGNGYFGLKRFAEALKNYDLSLQVCREIGDRQGESNELYNSAMVLDEMGLQKEARERLVKAVEIYEERESPYLEEAKEMLGRLSE